MFNRLVFGAIFLFALVDVIRVEGFGWQPSPIIVTHIAISAKLFASLALLNLYWGQKK